MNWWRGKKKVITSNSGGMKWTVMSHQWQVWTVPMLIQVQPYTWHNRNKKNDRINIKLLRSLNLSQNCVCFACTSSLCSQDYQAAPIQQCVILMSTIAFHKASSTVSQNPLVFQGCEKSDSFDTRMLPDWACLTPGVKWIKSPLNLTFISRWFMRNGPHVLRVQHCSLFPHLMGEVDWTYSSLDKVQGDVRPTYFNWKLQTTDPQS